VRARDRNIDKDRRGLFVGEVTFFYANRHLTFYYHRLYFFWVFSPTYHPGRVTPLESAVADKYRVLPVFGRNRRCVTRLLSALTIGHDHNPFRMRTYRKPGGRGPRQILFTTSRSTQKQLRWNTPRSHCARSLSGSAAIRSEETTAPRSSCAARNCRLRPARCGQGMPARPSVRLRRAGGDL
jgi:hypothetical protein